ncbi:MAG: restriction endonuclease [Thermodesulfobacteriota bacterium]
MDYKPKDIAEYIIQRFQKPQARIEELIDDYLNECVEETLSEIQRSEIIATIEVSVKCRLEKHVNLCRDQGLTPSFRFGECDKSLLINQEYKLGSAYADCREWISNLPPAKFESLCRIVLTAEGCENVQVTRFSGDAGVDFFGTKTIRQHTPDGPDIFRNMELLVIGQAKRYSDSVQIDEIRNFLGALSLLRIAGLETRPGFIQCPVNMLSYRPFSPILLIFIASSDAGGNTYDFAKWLGVRFIGGRELTEILYNNGVGFLKYGSTVKFSPNHVKDL